MSCGYVWFGVLSFGLMSFGVMSFGLLSVYHKKDMKLNRRANRIKKVTMQGEKKNNSAESDILYNEKMKYAKYKLI